MAAQALVGIVMGSDSDWPVMKAAAEALAEFDVPVEVDVVSAHRQPEKMIAYGRSAADRGLRVVIAGAGGAAHLPGMLAAVTHAARGRRPGPAGATSTAWTRCSRSCRCPPGSPWPPCPSAERATPACSPCASSRRARASRPPACATAMAAFQEDLQGQADGKGERLRRRRRAARAWGSALLRPPSGLGSGAGHPADRAGRAASRRGSPPRTPGQVRVQQDGRADVAAGAVVDARDRRRARDAVRAVGRAEREREPAPCRRCPTRRSRSARRVPGVDRARPAGPAGTTSWLGLHLGHDGADELPLPLRAADVAGGVRLAHAGERERLVPSTSWQPAVHTMPESASFTSASWQRFTPPTASTICSTPAIPISA